MSDPQRTLTPTLSLKGEGVLGGLFFANPRQGYLRHYYGIDRIMLNDLRFVNGELTAQLSLPILSLRNFDSALPLDGGGLTCLWQSWG